jgi:HAMP domain-containing protein/putative methionine-R-sulfoxide reductase with GAF domain
VARRITVVAGSAAAVAGAVVWASLLFGGVLAYAPAATRARVLLLALVGGVVVVAVVTGAVILTVRRNLGAPLQDLADAMASAEKGDYLVRAPADRPDELGSLGRSFNLLLRQITAQQVDIIDTGHALKETRRELDLKRQLAEKAGIIESQNRTLETQLAELELLYETSRIITSQLELPQLLATLCDQVGKTLGFEEFAILLMDEPSGQLVVSATWGFPDGDAVRGLRFDPGEGVAGIVARSREWLLIPDTSKDERYLHFKGRHRRDGSLLCVPLIHRDRLVGLFNVMRPRVDAIGESEIRILVALASSAALAISNARAYAPAQTAAAGGR